MTEALRLGLGLGLVLSPFAGLMAFLITYEEYRRHYPDRGPAFRAGVEVGTVALLVFLALSVVAGVLAFNVAR